VVDDDGAVSGVFGSVTAQTSGVRRDGSHVDEAKLRNERGALVAIEAGEAQRRQISRQLHDELGQELAALVLGLKAARDVVPEDAPVRRHLQRLQAMDANKSGRAPHRA
jgi:signal transduction histidine kinase